MIRPYGHRPFAYFPDDGLSDGNGAGPALVPQDESDLPEGGFGEGPEDSFEPLFPAAPAAAEEKDPWEGFGDEERRIAEQKGWKTPADALKSYKELESELGRRGQSERAELDRMRAELQQLQQQISQPPAQQQPAQRPGGSDDPLAEVFAPVDFAELERVGNGDPRTMLHIYHEQVALPQMKQALATMGAELLGYVGGQVEEIGGQVGQVSTRVSLNDQAAQLARDFGPRFQELRNDVVAMVERNPQLASQPNGLKQAFHEVLAQKVREEDAARRSQEGEALVGGRTPSNRGGQRAPENPAAAVRAAIEGVAGFTGNDGLV